MPSGRRPNTVSNIEAKIQAKQATLATPGINPANRAKTVKNISRLSRTLRSRSEQPPNPIGDMVRPPVAAVAAELPPVIEADELEKDNDEGEVAPETAPEVAPEVAPETAPEVAPEVAVPEVAVPEVAPEIAPETAPEVAPEVPATSQAPKTTIRIKRQKPQPVVADTIIASPGCDKFYDPCTKEELSDFTTLEKQVRELKKKITIIPYGLYGLSNKTTNYEFLTTVFVNPEISLDDMVTFALQEGGNPGSDIFEVLCRLFVLFGGIQDVNPRQGGNFKFMLKIENKDNKLYENSIDALKDMKCKANRVMGISDITLTRTDSTGKAIKPDDPYCEIDCDTTISKEIKTYLMSVKWYKKEKNAEHVDLEKLFTAAKTITTPEQNPVGIIVFIKSKTEFQRANNRMYRQYVRELADKFFGWDEDVKPFLQEIRRQIFDLSQFKNITTKEALQLQYLSTTAKPSLSLQLHQDIIVNGICNSLDTSQDNRYLIGVLPRGGKTYIAGGIIREYLRRNPVSNLNIFWITAAPTETRSQVQYDLLDKLQDFNDFEFVDTKNSFAEIQKSRTKPHRVYFCSTQLLNARTAGRAKEREFLTNLLIGKDRIGLVFFDEAHKTGVGKGTKDEILELLNLYPNTLPFIFLTATYYNILLDYQILKENTFIWDYTDVLSARGLGVSSYQQDALDVIKKRFTEKLVTPIIERRLHNGDSFQTIAKAYIDYPDLYFISADFQEEALQRFEEQNVYRPNAGFSLESIFAIKPKLSIIDIKTANNKIRKDAYKIFANLTNPRNIISLITPSTETFEDSEEGGEPLRQAEDEYIEPTILGRINKISSDSKSRFRLDEQPTILMFMPVGGTGSNILFLLAAWASLLLSHPWWRKRYEVACIVGDQSLTGDNIQRATAGAPSESSDSIHIISKNPKPTILELERKLHCSKGKGLIILAGQMLSMGISLPCTDVVFLFNSTKSPDDIIQKMYRGLTPSPGKTSAFIVDLNPVRTLAALYGYTRAANEAANTTSDILDIIYDTYTWDADIFEHNLSKGANSKPLSFQQRLNDLFAAAEKDPSGDYRINEDFGAFEKKLGENIRRKIDSEFVGKLASQFSDTRLDSIRQAIGLKDANITLDKTGKLVIRSEKPEQLGDGSEEGVVSNEEQNIEIVIDNFIETVSDFVKYLAITSDKATLDEALAQYETSIVNSTGTSLQGNVVKLVRARTALKGVDDTILSNLLITAVKEFGRDSSERIFRQMKGKVDEKSLRKDKILAIIHKRLTPRQKQKKDFGEVFTPIELIEDMLSHLPSSDWKNPNLKWLDPANGIGNFPVVIFYKLDEGLKSWEPNEKKRRQHILKNMIFMMEKQSNNNRIARNIFSSLCDGCEGNIWTVDSLSKTKEQILEHFGIDKIDRVVGNPPFQAYQEADGKRGGGDELYMKFVKTYIDVLDNNGYLVFVHPPSWRKPEFNEGRKKSKNAGMFDLMAHQNQIKYLEMHDSKDGMKVFNAGTRYDFYVLEKTPIYEATEVKDILGNKIEVNLKDFDFLPNFNMKQIDKLFPKSSDEKCELSKCVLYERSAYGTDKSWVSANETSVFKYPLIHTTPQSGPVYYYSNTKDKGFFGIPKVIFGESGINDPIIDMDGKYGMTQGAIGIHIENKTEAEKLSTFLKSNYFTNILKANSWGGFRIDWRLFTYFKNKFWVVNVNLDEKLIDIKDTDEEKVPKKGGSRQRFNKTRRNRA